MFMLCMSREESHSNPSYEDRLKRTVRPIKGGYLLRYKRGLLHKKWSEEWFVLYEDSTFSWYDDKGLQQPRGSIYIRDAPELIAIGEWTIRVPHRPRLPQNCQIGQTIAIGTKDSSHILWLLAQSTDEVSDWMSAFNKILPPPRCQTKNINQNKDVFMRPQSDASNISKNKYCNEHTVLSGVVIGWGHGTGWSNSALMPNFFDGQQVSSIHHCHTTNEYVLDSCNDFDWSSFGDFGF